MLDDLEKQRKDEQERNDKKKNRENQKAKIEEMEYIAKRLDQRNSAIFGILTTVMFLTFAMMHISQSITGYNISQMNKFNQATTFSLFPDIDVNDHLSPKQWTKLE